uniref:Peptidase S1 domain-containing protein n=1 Tax=Nothobranchius kuhntae TaxID=321403 RepID=A0A1A8JU27_NOTKU
MAVSKPLLLLALVLHNTRDLLGAEVKSSIVGGDDATKGGWPWMVYLSIKTDDGAQKWQCGATILNEYWLLTAGQCWDDQLISRWDRVGVWIGTHKLREPSARYMHVRTIIRHPEYRAQGYGYINDISLIQLKKRISFSKLVSKVNLPGADDTFTSSSECWITGWGDIRKDVPLPDPGVLQQLKIPILAQSECRAWYPEVTDAMLCAGNPAGGKDACKGDYGGPLVCRTGSGFVQVGIMSYGNPDGCGIPGRPGVYTRVSKYLAFINNYISQEP